MCIVEVGSSCFVFIYQLENRKEAFSIELQQYCLSQPVCVIRGLAGALKLGEKCYKAFSNILLSTGHNVLLLTNGIFWLSENLQVFLMHKLGENGT